MGMRGYVKALPVMVKRQFEQDTYKEYVTDALKAIASNTSNYVIPGYGAVQYGSYYEIRYADIINGKTSKPEETAESVIERVTKALSKTR